MIDARLKQWATAVQANYIDLVIEHGGIKAAARAHGVAPVTVRRAIQAVQKKARDANTPNGTPGFVASGRSAEFDEDGNLKKEWLHEIPGTPFEPGGVGESEARDGTGPYITKGVSTLYGPDGNQRAQWVKTALDTKQQALMMSAAAAAMAEDIPRLAPVPMPSACVQDLCNLYTLTDSHVGMLAWDKETGADWDLKIAEETLFRCFEQMVKAAPPAKVGIVNQLGDWVHFDGLQAITPTSGHLLDADSRFSKVVAVAIRILRRVIDLALLHHETVHVIMAEGNHDMASSVWLRQMFKALYEDEPRVTVNDNEVPYYVYQFGKTMLGFHHSHLSKKEKLPLLFAAMFPVKWGQTTKRYINTGHLHHVDEKEHPGVKVIQHPTLAARDAYAARGGWLSEREATAMTFHRQFGMVARNTVTPEMVAC